MILYAVASSLRRDGVFAQELPASPFMTPYFNVGLHTWGRRPLDCSGRDSVWLLGRVRVHLTDARAAQALRPQPGDHRGGYSSSRRHGSYLVTRDFFSDLGRRLRPNGIALFKAPSPTSIVPSPTRAGLATLREELPCIVLSPPDWPGTAHVNSFIVTGPANRPPPDPGRRARWIADERSFTPFGGRFREAEGPPFPRIPDHGRLWRQDGRYNIRN